MTDLSNQKRMAAEILGVGIHRVWMDPEASEDIATAPTREDIRELINEGYIKRKQKKGISRGRARARDVKKAYGHRKGHGSRKGAKGARSPRKAQWMRKIRALRKRLMALRAEGALDATAYRKLYNKAKGGEFRNVGHLNNYMITKGYLEE